MCRLSNARAVYSMDPISSPVPKSMQEPRLITGRHDVWNTDEEWGRLFLAGIDPSGIFALKYMPEKAGSSIRPEHVDGEVAVGIVYRMGSQWHGPAVGALKHVHAC